MENHSTSAKKKRNARKGYWVKETIHYCPVCGRESRFRERQYDTPKPDDWNARNRWIEFYDWCDG